ncbi:MAG TPA: hypothetical protein DCM68_02910 [Verrucomicrobia bacterium]|nr:hypothetical protein [Verrucomicrobiota bacterium]
MLMLFSGVAAGLAEEPEAVPFGASAAQAVAPEREVPLQDSFAATMRLEGIYELEDGNLRVAITDTKDNSTFALKVGETNAAGVVLLDVDYDQEWATLEKDGLTVQLRMHGTATTETVTEAEKQDRIQQAEERRMSYAERRKLRREAGQKPENEYKALNPGDVKERRLQEYQMEVLRQGVVSPPPPGLGR